MCLGGTWNKVPPLYKKGDYVCEDLKARII